MRATIPPPTQPEAQQRPSLLGRAALALIPVALAAAVYYPIIRNYFYLDDFLNLYRIQNVNVWEYVFTPHGGHILLTRNALFYLFAEVFGPQPSRFFWAVLVTHLLNVALLFAAIRGWTGSARLACLGATLWGTSPLNEGSLGWYSVYGQVVVATTYLPILVSAARLGSTGNQPSRGQRWTWYALTLLASTSFGVGIGLALSLPVVLLLILPRRERRPWLPPLASVLVVVPVLYVATHWAYSVLSGEVIRAGLMATLFFGNWPQVASTLFHLIAYGATQLVLGFYLLPPDQYGHSISYASAALLLGATLVAWVRGSTVGRRRLIASSLIVAICYTTIAVGRAAIFSNLTMVTVVSQPRYHYVGFIALTLLISVILANVSSPSFPRPAIKNVLLLVCLAVLGAGYAWKRPAIDPHTEARNATGFALNWMRVRIDETPPGEVVYLFNKPFEPVPHMWMPQAVFPGWAAIYVIFYPQNAVDGKPIRFVHRSRDVVEAARRGVRSATLIIGSEEWKRAQEIKSAPPSEPSQ